ncbi:MAG: hypothetical protein GX649_14880 [Chloroflexi bacterium]|nr:hypothetical protein [Chloroflexota bacterium]
MGVIDTLTAGFQVVVRKPWLLLIPLLLDLVLLASPKVSVEPLFEDMAAIAEETLGLAGEVQPGGAEAAAAPSAGDANVLAAMEQMDLLRAAMADFNLLSLLALNRLLLPSIAGIRAIDPAADSVIQVGSMGQAAMIALVLVGLGLFLACAFWTLLAQQVRRDRNSLTDLGRQVPVFWLRMIAVGVIVLGFMLVLGVVGVLISLAAQVFALLGVAAVAQVVTGLLMYAMWLVVLWLMFYLVFVPQAVTLAEASPMGALRQSFIIVRATFWRTLILFVLVNIISTGLGYLWVLLMTSLAGTLAAIVANAFVGTGLVAAMFIFFRDRIIALHHAQLHLQATRSGSA